MSNTRCIDLAKKSLPHLMLALSSILYASAYPSITVMNNLLPPSFTTMARMILASIPLLPFLCRLERKLVLVTILSGCFDAMAHITLSLVRIFNVLLLQEGCLVNNMSHYSISISFSHWCTPALPDLPSWDVFQRLCAPSWKQCLINVISPFAMHLKCG